jgi:hypothetical protein
MAIIYENAYLTIAAVYSSQGSMSCFRDTAFTYIENSVPEFEHNDSAVKIRQAMPVFPKSMVVEESNGQWPLLTRGWVY